MSSYKESVEGLGLRPFQCHKLVHAARIEGIDRTERVGAPAYLSLESGRIYEASESWFLKHEPHTGGYLVLYKDGYISFSPAEPFEDGYHATFNDPADQP